MADFREALESILPIAWSDLPSDADLPSFLRDSFTHAEHIVNSIPAPSASDSDSYSPPAANSASDALGTVCSQEDVPMPEYTRDATATKAWGKPYKLSTKDNPLRVSCYKMAAYDRHGAYFARRSVHHGIGFDRWRRCAVREFAESVKHQGAPGAGAVRGISADRRVEKKTVDGVANVEVWQTSSAFPGPVTPRESLTMVITSQSGLSNMPDGKPPPRHLTVLSRPTTHDDAPDRQNLVKMAYESAEIIREIPIAGNDDPEANPVEWLMVTRSDPGGGIPKFLVERGTPSSITGDVVKFLDWATKKPWSELEGEPEDEEEQIEQANQKAQGVAESTDGAKPASHATKGNDNDAQEPDGDGSQNIVAKAAGAVASAAAGYIPYFHSKTGDSDASSVSSSDSSGTFASALDDIDGEKTTHHYDAYSGNLPQMSETSLDARASLDSGSSSRTLKDKEKHSKELARLIDKRASIDARAARERESVEKKLAAAGEKEAKSREKAVSKHERERRTLEERYQREIAKLDARRVKEEKRQAEKVRKAEARDELATARREASEWRERCAVAEKERDLLREQVEGLQREITASVARLSREDADAVRKEVEESR